MIRFSGPCILINLHKASYLLPCQGKQLLDLVMGKGAVIDTTNNGLKERAKEFILLLPKSSTSLKSRITFEGV